MVVYGTIILSTAAILISTLMLAASDARVPNVADPIETYFHNTTYLRTAGLVHLATWLVSIAPAIAWIATHLAFTPAERFRYRESALALSGLILITQAFSAKLAILLIPILNRNNFDSLGAAHEAAFVASFGVATSEILVPGMLAQLAWGFVWWFARDT